MENLIIVVLIFDLLVLISVLVIKESKIASLRNSNILKADKINELLRNYNASKAEYTELEDKVLILKSNNINLSMYLNNFINEKYKVYVNSNFHSNYNIYNGKFYAKISKSPTSTRIEAIPVLPIIGNKYTVIDIYKLRKRQKDFPNQSILSHIEASKTAKEEMIGVLGNKVLTSYER